jgi:transposase-like protein
MAGGSNFKGPYPPEFRCEAVELSRRSGRPVAEIVRGLAVASESLRRSWAGSAARIGFWARNARCCEEPRPSSETR